MKKLLVLIVALAMVMATAVPAFAGEKYGAPWTKIHNVELGFWESNIYVYGYNGNYYGSFTRNLLLDGGKVYGGPQTVEDCLKGEVIIKTVKGTYTAKLVEHGDGNAQNNPLLDEDNYWIEDLQLKPDEPPIDPPIEDTYNLVYEENIGDSEDTVTNMPQKEINLPNGSVDLSKQEPVREGYTFKGWGENPESKAPISQVTIENQHVWVYAIWEEEEPAKQYTLTYDKNLPIDVSNMPGQESLENGSALLSTMEPIAEGYKFIGWAATPDGREPLVQIEINGVNVTVYAIWEKNTPPVVPPGPVIVPPEEPPVIVPPEEDDPGNTESPEPPVIVPPEEDDPGNTESPEPPVVVPPEEDDPGNTESPEPPVVVPPEEDDLGNTESPEPLDEERDDSKTDPNQPKTDDNSNMMLYVLLTLGSMGALNVIWGRKKDEK